MYKSSLLIGLLTLSVAHAENFLVGFSKVDITPYEFEVPKKQTFYQIGKPFWDTGVDRQFDYEEPGAFGADGKPGIAGVDDDKNGVVDDCAREKCAEYLSSFSDDIKDPHQDNYHLVSHPNGTEGNGVFNHITLGGFGPYYPIPFIENRMALGVHDPIWSRAMVVTDSTNKTVVLVSTDLPGLTWKYINPVRRKVQEVFGIPVENIIITSTHNHAGPDAAGYWSTLLPGRNRKYISQLKKWMFNSIAEAIRSQEPALMKTASGFPVGCYDNKTKEFKKEQDCHFPMNSTDYRKPNHNYDIQAIQTDKRDPIVRNNEFTISQFISLKTNQTLGTFLNYHNHPDDLGSDNLMITSDFVGFLRDYVETQLGGIAVYFSGTVGCQIGQSDYVPKWTKEMTPVYDGQNRALANFEDKWELSMSAGYEVAHDMVKAVSDQQKFNQEYDIDVLTKPLDIAPVNILHIFTTRSVWFSDVEYEDSMRMYGWRCKPPRGCVRSDVSKIRIGDLTIMTAPGEIDPVYWTGRKQSLAEYGGKWGNKLYPALPGVRANLKTTYNAVLGQANNYLSYLIPQVDNVGALRLNHPNHYEDLVTVNKRFGDDLGNLWMWMTDSSYRYNKRKILPKP